jgi:primosomal protein N' (replication factor Y) (superfamily II helicase)
LVLSKILSGEIKILLGARSAIFAPFRNLGLIIIDEEQEDSYKQEQKPSYDARRIADWRAKLNNATLVFGSATPSIETFFMSQNENDDCKVLELPYKASEISENDSEIKINRNEIAIIDMKVELLKKNFSVISEYLRKEIEKRLDKKEQILLFLNRRGDSTFVFCRKCGFVMKCPHCNVSLVYHSDNEKLQCHYCGYSVDNVSECPSCKSKYIKYFGNAIQKVEKEIKKIFPYAKVARLDKDISSQDRGYNFDIYKLFKNKKIDILIGTQMIAKGFDFENLSLVGVISADTALNLADFRASEKTFNLLVQVIGRAGRKNKGLGIIQTYYPENYAILNAKNLNYLDFYKQEIQWRKELNYPPFSKIILITFRGKNNELVEKEISNLYDILISDTLLKDNDELDILGVYQPTIIKKYDNFRWQILIKIKILKKDEDSQLNNYCQKVYELVKLSKNLNTLESKNIKVSVTVDPTQML